MMHRAKQSIIVRHKEYVGDIYSSTSFALQQSLSLNPGLPSSFPWLANIAQSYQEYTWKGMVFHYIPTSGDAINGTNPALGSVMIATSYRATAPVFTSKQVMLNEYCSSDGKPSESFVHPIECDPKENPYNVQYVRGSAVPSGEDQKTYDLGTTVISTSGMPATGNIVGELWVTYEVELKKPIMTSTYLPEAIYYTETRTGTISAAVPFGSTLGSPSQSNPSFTVSGSSIVFPKNNVGSYYILLSYAGAGMTALAAHGFAATNCNLFPIISPVASTLTLGGGFHTYILPLEISDAAVQATITQNGTAFFTGACASVVIRIVEINGDSI
jgi:hypothetical protein